MVWQCTAVVHDSGVVMHGSGAWQWGGAAWQWSGSGVAVLGSGVAVYGSGAAICQWCGVIHATALQKICQFSLIFTIFSPSI